MQEHNARKPIRSSAEVGSAKSILRQAAYVRCHVTSLVHAISVVVAVAVVSHAIIVKFVLVLPAHTSPGPHIVRHDPLRLYVHLLP